MSTRDPQKDSIKAKQHEIEIFFERIGLATQKERDAFRQFELPLQKDADKYEVKILNNTQQYHG